MAIKDQATMSVLERVGKEGIIAIWFTAVMIFIGSGLWFGGKFLANRTDDFLTAQKETMTTLADSQHQITEAMETMVTFSKDVAIVHSNQQATLDKLGELAATAATRDDDLAAQLQVLVEEMQKANVMMSDSVGDRQESQAALEEVLKRIEVGIEDLNSRMKDWCEVTQPQEQP